MLTDFHSHILPGIDDGSKRVSDSLAMLKILRSQGVERVIFTPHFYAHRNESVNSFIKRRQRAYNMLKKHNLPVKDVRLGAEIAIEKGISNAANIDKLAIQGTKLILLELPYKAYADWMSEEIYDIYCTYKVMPIIAHVHRYLNYYSKAEIQTILNSRAIFQINNEAFSSWKERRFVRNLIKEGYPLVFGSDCHNLNKRKPNFDLLKKKNKKANIINDSNDIFDEYII